MRIVKILLVLVFLAVTAVYTLQSMTDRASAADDPPVISCDTEVLEVSVTDPDSVLLSGVTAADAQDGDLTDQVLISGVSKLMADNTAKVTCVVFDSDDNMATLTRQIRYTDYRLPRFSLTEPLVYTSSADIPLLDRLHAHDVVDGNLTRYIRVSYIVYSDASCVHSIDAQVTNSMGDTAWLTLPVILVENPEKWVDVYLDTYVLYLEQGDDFRAPDHLVAAEYIGDSVSLGNVTISGEVDTTTPGTYTVTYQCDYLSNSGLAVLTVVVE